MLVSPLRMQQRDDEKLSEQEGASSPLPCVASRVGHAYAEYANDADYAHMRNMRMRMRIENLIHIIHI